MSGLGEVPPGVVAYLARQLRITDPTALARYQQGERRQEHALEIRAARKLREWSDGRATFPLVRLLYARVWLSNERPSILFDQAVSWLKKHEELLARYLTVRRFLPTLLRTITFAGTPAARQVLEALRFLTRLEGQKKPSMQEAPLAGVPERWRRYVAPKGGGIDRNAYTLCVLEQLHEGLRRGDLFVPGSGRWADPRAKLLSGSAWEAAKSSVCPVLGRSPMADPDLALWARELDAAYRRTATNLPTNTAVRFETERDAKTGKTEERLVLERLEEEDRPPARLH